MQELTKKQQEVNIELEASECSLQRLRDLCWHGLTESQRPLVWKILLGYLPPTLGSRESTLSRKRGEYQGYTVSIYEEREQHQTEKHQKDQKQIHEDIPRTQPDLPLFRSEAIQRILARILYIWSVRHPASGYVQGMNDLCSIFLLVFLNESVPFTQLVSLETLPENVAEIEADSYWCMSIVLDTIQDYFFPFSPGIQRAINKIGEIITRLDNDLAQHFAGMEIQLIHFTFRWFNCMFTREFPLTLVFRLWDTLISHPDGYSALSVYVASALVLKYSNVLKEKEFNDLLLFMQSLPTTNWSKDDLESLMSMAFVHYSWFHNSPNHLKNP